MTFVRRSVFRLAGLMLVAATPACAQDNLERGKSAQEIFASDCSICHKTPQGLAKSGGGLFGLQGFLREHYTTSRETASLLARYLEAAGEPPAADQRRQQRRAVKPAGTKPVEAKPADTKPSDSKPAEAKPSDAKPMDAKPADTKPEAKPEAKPESKPEPKPESKPEPKESSGTEIKSGIAVSPAPAEKPKSE
jgi:outer membrane biosynthesis protein TonB